MQTLKKSSRGQDVRTLQALLSLHIDGIFGPITQEAVIAYQKEHHLTPDGIVGPATWAALGQKTAFPRTINKIILHCSATPEGEDFTVEQIRNIHLARGFSDIGYHYIIYRDGTIHTGRSEATIGAHTTGHNSTSIGVCYIGGCPPRTDPKWAGKAKDTRTPAQKESMRSLVKKLRQRYPSATIHGHYEFANKACPSFKICDL